MYGWEESYKAAALETDHSKLPERIKAALIAIHRRIRELNLGHDSLQERYAIREALHVLTVVSNDAEGATPGQ
jgi:hypothetical protein